MATTKDETASFVLRFTQKIYKSDEGEPQIQWRGNIRHVQSGEEARFSDFANATEFVQGKLADLTQKAVEDKSPEEQKSVLSKSFDLWKKVATAAPKIVMESIKDPKKQAALIQEKLQEQMHQVGDAIEQKIEDTIGQKIEIDDWKVSSKSDLKNVMKMLEKLTEEMASLNKKVDKLAKKKNAIA